MGKTDNQADEHRQMRGRIDRQTDKQKVQQVSGKREMEGQRDRWGQVPYRPGPRPVSCSPAPPPGSPSACRTFPANKNKVRKK